MDEYPIEEKQRLIDAVKKRLKGARGKESKIIPIILDSFLDKTIATYENCEHKISKRKIIKKIDKKNQELSKRKRFLGEIRRLINWKLHGKDPCRLFNPEYPFYIDSDKDNLIGVFFDIYKIQEICLKQLGKIEIRTIYNNTTDCTYLGKRRLDWMEVYLSKNIKEGISIGDIQIDFISEEQSFLSDLKTYKKEKLDDWKKKSNFEYPYPGTTYGISNLIVNETPENRKLDISLKHTNHFNFLVLQESLKKLHNDSIDFSIGNERLYQRFHSISPTALVIVKDGEMEYTVFVKRNKSKFVSTGQGLIGLPICITPKRNPSEYELKTLMKKGCKKSDFKGDEEDETDFFYSVIKRGCEEELGVQLLDCNFRFLAFGIDTHRYLCNLIGVAKVESPIDKISEEFTVKGKRQFRVLPPVQFNPNEIVKFLAQIKSKEQCATTHMAAYYALCHCFDEGKVNKCFKTLK